MVFVEFRVEAPSGAVVAINRCAESQPAWLKSAHHSVRRSALPGRGRGRCRQQRQFIERDVSVIVPPRSAAGQAGIGQGFDTKSLDALQFGREHER